MPQTKVFHIRSPLIKSKPLSKKAGKDVYLKLDNLQLPGSFKIRGIGRTCQEAVLINGAKRLVGSSGGNAGVAMAYAAEELGVPLVLFIPTSTPPIILERLKDYPGAEVRIAGTNWDAANQEAMTLLEQDPEAFFVHPFEQETTWQGHATLVDEIKEQLVQEHSDLRVPASLITCVGGGGLAAGLIIGLQKHGWTKVPLVCMETTGSQCLYQSVKQGRQVKLDAIETIAKSLGALAVCSKLLDLAKIHPVIPKVVTDAQALDACFKFAQDHRMLVEPACGAVLSALYSDKLNDCETDIGGDASPIVVIVCGGNMASMDLFQMWKDQRRMELK
ncbi:hypothetical protein TCAL_13271 [Tigriopus californicus]|uniref:L-serine ammonia-lyase n=1 Tax=Tigriopus californicus TaxID=6832 RepID=A0A553PTR1_TIGCA|nr:serine dehydratase-like [Tigriopus californicus]TRY81067.1 hypothetical protein TCAL_13271 [Tigriopus californicus]